VSYIITDTNFKINSKQTLGLLISLLSFILLLFFTFTNTYKWINRPFHGFLVMKNQVVASISLPNWEGTRDGEILQSKVIEVDGHPIKSIRDLWKRLEHSFVGETITYIFIKENHPFHKQIHALLFSYKDFILLFGFYIFNGIAFFLTGLFVYLLRPKSPSGLSLFSVGLVVGIFFLTACDLYSPYWFFRLHVLSEAFMPASVFHLYFTFPQEKKYLNRNRLWILLAYLLSLSLCIIYEMWLFSHKGYVIIHNLCTLYFGIVLLLFIFSLFLNYYRTNSIVVKYKVRTVMWGALLALFPPAVIITYSALQLGEFAINFSVFTTFIFPIALGYAIVRRNLFEIDKIIQRSLFYIIFSGSIIFVYLSIVVVFNTLFQGMNSTTSPYFVIPFILLVILLLNPLKERIQSVVDRMFYHIRVDYQKVLEESSTTLTTLVNREHIYQHIVKNVAEIIRPENILLMILDVKGEVYRSAIADGFEGNQLKDLKLSKENWLVKKLKQMRRELTAFDVEDFYKERTNSDNLFHSLLKMKTQVIIPLIFENELEGFIIVGRKKSGFNYHSKEFEFLRTLANQATLSLVNSKSYEELKIAQQELVHNEKLKLVGEMANMIVHDFKGPMTTIRCSAEFLEIDSLSEDNRAKYCKKIQGEVDRLVAMSRELTEFSSGSKKLILNTHSVKAFIKEIVDSLEENFQKNGFAFTTNLTYTGELTFDYEKLKRGILNLAHNALEAMPNGGFLSISNQLNNSHIEFLIEDTGKGIPPRIINKIFDPFFTHDKSGGTGLGLCITKDIINNHSGDIWVRSEEGCGTTFHFTIPLNLSAQAAESPQSPSQDPSSTTLALDKRLES